MGFGRFGGFQGFKKVPRRSKRFADGSGGFKELATELAVPTGCGFSGAFARSKVPRVIGKGTEWPPE
jgi:hypothetical protein